MAANGPCMKLLHDTVVATNCKNKKCTGLLFRSCSNHKLRASVKKYSGHGDSFEETMCHLYFFTLALCLRLRLQGLRESNLVHIHLYTSTR
jgi:hypothetical protein